MSLPGISLRESDGQIFLLCEPTATRAEIDSAALYALLEQQAYGQCLRHEEALANAVQRANAHGEAFELLVAQRCDAQFKVLIAADEMAAELDMTPPRGGKAAELDDILRALSDAGVVFGIDDALLRQVAMAATPQCIRVAVGTPAQDGHDTVFEELIEQSVERAPKLDDGGLIDYREHGTVQVVQAGTALMRRIPATPGVAGHSIRGRTLASRPGRDEPFAKKLDGVAVASDDPNVIQAAVAGMPVRVAHGIVVEPVLRLPEVNMSTGNIHFDGCVQIDGDVIQGMTVQVSGDILVKGLVDGGRLEAGGNIEVAGGVIAHAKLVAGASVHVRFAESAQISAATLIDIADMALECELHALKQIIVGAQNKRGRLIAGCASAMMLIKTPQLGAAKAAITKLVLGVNPVLQARHQAVLSELAKQQALEENLQKLIKHLTDHGDPRGMLQRATESRNNALQAYAKLLLERDELAKQLELGKDAQLEVGVALAGPVNLSIGKVSVVLNRELDAGSFRLNDEGVIVYTDRSGIAVPVL